MMLLSFEIRETGTVEHGMVNFYYTENSVMGSATIESFIYDVWYFNRLFLHRQLRNRGIGTALIRKVVAFCKENGITLFTGINPYGDLNYEQLKQFYLKNGFSVGTREDMLVILKEGDSFKRLQSVLESVGGAGA